MNSTRISRDKALTLNISFHLFVDAWAIVCVYLRERLHERGRAKPNERERARDPRQPHFCEYIDVAILTQNAADAYRRHRLLVLLLLVQMHNGVTVVILLLACVLFLA